MHFDKSKNIDTFELSTGISQLSLSWNIEFWRANSSQKDGELAQNGNPKLPASAHSISDLDGMTQSLVIQIPYM